MDNFKMALKSASELSSILKQRELLMEQAKAHRFAEIDCTLKADVLLEQHVLGMNSNAEGCSVQLWSKEEGAEYLDSPMGKKFISLLEEAGYKVTPEIIEEPNDEGARLKIYMEFPD
jgi:hypothetical protein